MRRLYDTILQFSGMSLEKRMDEAEENALLALSDEILRKVGRNVVLFQKIEGLLKFILVNCRTHEVADDFILRQERRLDEVKKQPMGQLVGQYVDNVLSDIGESAQISENPSIPSFSFSFKRTGDSEFYESQRENLKLMVDQRNELIHHFLPRWRPDSRDALWDASSYLDMQRERVLPMLEDLESVSRSMRETKQALADFLISDAGQQHLELLWLQASPLICLLHDITTQIRRSDGWTDVSHAGQLVRQYDHDAVINMKELYGYSTFKKLLIASELFDVFDETLPMGNFRTLYRVKKRQ